MAIQCDFVCQNLVKGKEKRKRKIRIKGGETGALLKGDFLAQLFSCEFCEIFQNTCKRLFLLYMERHSDHLGKNNR